MGVQGLLQLLKSIQRPCHVKSFAGLTLGVDAYCWLHPGTIPCAVALATGKHTTRYVDYVMHRIRMLQHYGITPYVVFDGGSLPSKAGTEDKRAVSRAEARRKGLELLRLGRSTEAHHELQKSIDVTPEMARNLMEELKKLNIKYVVAPYEADAQLAYLEREGIIEGIISEDSDLLVYGAKKLITKLDKYGECVEIRREDFTACRAVSFVGWTDDMFRRMAIMTGCDYLEGLPKTGLKTAHNLIRRYKDMERILRVLQFDGKVRIPEGYAERFKKAESTFLHQWVYCPDKQRLVMGTPWPVDQRPDDISHIGAELSVSIAIGVANGNLHPITKRPLKATTGIQNDRTRKSYAQRDQLLSTPSDLKGQKKPIDSFFKPKRTPLAELDPNCFTPSPSQDELLRRHPGSVSSTPVDENNNSNNNRPHSFAAPSTVSQSTGRARQTRDVLGLANASQSAPHPTKRQRLCEDTSPQDKAKDTKAIGGTQSRFFATRAPEPSPTIKRQVRHKQKIQNFSIHDENLKDSSMKLYLPDPSDMAPPEMPKLSIFKDSQTTTTAAAESSSVNAQRALHESQSTVSLSASTSTLSSTSTDATSLSFASPSTPLSQYSNEGSQESLGDLHEKFSFSAKSIDEPKAQLLPSKQPLLRRESALRRLGRQAIQRTQSLPNFVEPPSTAVTTTSDADDTAADGADDDLEEPLSLPNWNFGPKAAQASAIISTQGSEDFIVPNSEDDVPEDVSGEASSLNLGRFAFSG